MARDLPFRPPQVSRATWIPSAAYLHQGGCKPGCRKVPLRTVIPSDFYRIPYLVRLSRYFFHRHTFTQNLAHSQDRPSHTVRRRHSVPCPHAILGEGEGILDITHAGLNPNAANTISDQLRRHFDFGIMAPWAVHGTTFRYRGTNARHPRWNYVEC